MSKSEYAPPLAPVGDAASVQETGESKVGNAAPGQKSESGPATAGSIGSAAASVPPASSGGFSQAAGWHLPPHATHADPLLDCLVQLTRLHGKPYTAQALSNGLPLVDQRLTPSLLARAAARAQFSTRIVRRDLVDVPQGLLPAILILNGNQACLLLKPLEDGRVKAQTTAETSTQTYNSWFSKVWEPTAEA